MITLETHIRNLCPACENFFSPNPSQSLTLRIGALQTDITIQGEAGKLYGGKRMILDINKEQIRNYFTVYALGLFMQNLSGRFWCLMSLESIQIGEQYSFSKLYFYNDDRNVCYIFDFLVSLTEHHPKQLHITNQVSGKHSEISSPSFLYGKKITANKPPKQPSNENTVKLKQNLKQKIEKDIQKQQLKNKTYLDDLDEKVYLPPTIQFTNNEPVIIQSDSPREQKAKLQEQKRGRQSADIYKQTKGPGISKHSNDKQSEMNRKKLRELARRQAEAEIKKRSDEVMVPFPSQSTGIYKLVPLSKMTEAQIVEYAQKQKLADQFKQAQNQRRVKKARNMQKKIEKQKLIGRIQNELRTQIGKQKVGLDKFSQKEPISQKNKESSSDIESVDSAEDEQQKPINVLPQPKDNFGRLDEQKDDQYDYESDFDSISNVGSQLKSRISLQSSMSISQDKERKKINESEISESMNDYEYSQDFESFSQSLASKNKRGSSISEISGSYVSTSNRKL